MQVQVRVQVQVSGLALVRVGGTDGPRAPRVPHSRPRSSLAALHALALGRVDACSPRVVSGGQRWSTVSIVHP